VEQGVEEDQERRRQEKVRPVILHSRARIAILIGPTLGAIAGQIISRERIERIFIELMTSDRKLKASREGSK